MRRVIVPIAVVTCLAGAAPLLAACGGDDDAGSDATESARDDDTQANDTSPDTAADPGSAEESDDTGSERSDGAEESDDTGSERSDGAAVDWATVDLAAIDWASIDMSTVDFAAIDKNPTAANVDEATVALIQQRYADEVAVGGGEAGSGEATLMIGAETWEFDGFVCAWGFQNTRSDVFSFTSNAFGSLADGTRTQLQLGIWDDTGTGALSGPGTEHEVTFQDIDDFDNPAVDWALLGPEFTFDGVEVSVEGTFFDEVNRAEQQGSFVGECGPGSAF